MILTPDGRVFQCRDTFLRDIAMRSWGLFDRAPLSKVVIPISQGTALAPHIFPSHPKAASNAVRLLLACKADEALHVSRLLEPAIGAFVVVGTFVPSLEGIALSRQGEFLRAQPTLGLIALLCAEALKRPG